MNVRLKSALVLLPLVTSFLTVPAAAQDIQGVFDMGLLTQSLSIDAVTQEERARAARQNGGAAAARSPVGGAIASQANASALRFAISPSRRQANIATFINDVAASNPQVRDNLRRAFVQNDFFGEVEPPLRQAFGMSLNNVADNAALWLATSWAASNDFEGDLTRAQFDGLRRQFSSTFLRNARLSALDDAGKQEMADHFLLKAMWIDMSVDAYKADPRKRAAYRFSVIETARRDMGIDFTTLNLTDSGLVPK
jgi:hypothetical protein